MNASPRTRPGPAAGQEAVGVLQMTDSLYPGGAEKAAVLIANSLPAGRFVSHLVTTREEGPLAGQVQPFVRRFHLGRKARFDPMAVLRLRRYIRREGIRIVHAHNTSIFLAAAATRSLPGVSLVWHDHFGTFGLETRSVRLWGIAARQAHAVLAVNETLAEWSRQVLGVPPARVRFLPNFVPDPGEVAPAQGLPGTAGARVICVANLRPQKDHGNLLDAMARVSSRRADAELLLVGRAGEPAAQRDLASTIAHRGLSSKVHWLGARDDVDRVLKACDVGVLSSCSEGLPLALLEYGMAGLAVVTTDVGACRDVVDEGRAGLLVPPKDPAALASALLSLLDDPVRRHQLGVALRVRVRTRFGEQNGIEQIVAVYASLLEEAAAR